MKSIKMSSGAVVCGALVLWGASGQAMAADTTDAATRLAEAQAAYDAALAELEAARAELRAEEAVRSDASSVTERVASADRVAMQPEPEPEKGFFDWKAWTKSVDIGLNGASGNSDNLNLRLQYVMERKTSKIETKATAIYRLSKQDGETTEDRFSFGVANDWLPQDGSKIRWWAKGLYEYDEFQEWDSRVSGAAGIGYELINNDKHTLIGRLGFGGSQTYGDADEEFRPEAVAGIDYTWAIKDGQKFGAGTEFLLDVSDTENYRVNSYAQYEVLLDAESNLTFKAGAMNRYDSEPGGDADKSDLEYYVSMGWTF